ncbi:MAG TPA: leucyl aminopeptidase [Acidimicrobiia bacterium]|nr:leucyl aminopeptidase [Acidimicrobiia bacterium]
MALSFSLTSTAIEKVRTPMLAVPVFKGPKLGAGARALDEALGGTLKAFLKETDFQANVGQTLAVPAGKALGADAVILVGLGDERKVDVDTLRRAAAAVARNSSKVAEVTTTFLDSLSDSLGESDAAQAVAEGFALGAYQYLDQKGAGSKNGSGPTKLRRVKIHGGGDAARRGLAHGDIVARGVNLARDLVNGPPKKVTPSEMARVARSIKGVRTTVWDKARCEQERLGGLLGVAAGSDEPPRLIRMTYTPERPRGTVAIVGKGITFDSGGINLKPSGFIETMKYDMAGGAAVIGLMSIVAELRPPVKVIGLVPATENMPSGKATKLGDVLTIRNGKTVEVLNTDAEGRLVLSDALCLAVEAGADLIVDLATLTGACPVALGEEIAGVMGNNADAVQLVKDAAERTGERVWELPMPDDYRKMLDSDVADLKNVSQGRAAGTITAALFLKEFVEDVPWAHLDIAGPAWRNNGANGYQPKGGTGWGVRLLAELLLGYRKPKKR